MTTSADAWTVSMGSTADTALKVAPDIPASTPASADHLYMVRTCRVAYVRKVIRVRVANGAMPAPRRRASTVAIAS
jgi:hypothetical protein